MQSKLDELIFFVKIIADELSQLHLKVESLEGALIPPAKGVEQPPGTTEPKIHGQTRAAMARHSPPLHLEEIKLWQIRIPEGRRFKTTSFAAKFFPGDKEGKAKSLRVCYWLIKAGVLFFDQSKWEYVRPVSSDVNAGNASC